MYETIEVQRRGAALHIRLNRPDAYNAVNRRLAMELLAALREAAADDEVRAICLTGAGRGFSAGGDLKDVSGLQLTPEGHPDMAAPLREHYSPIVQTIRDMPKPVVAAVHGGAAGIGCSFALACDLVVAHESAYFLLAFVHINLAPDGGGLAFIAARAGITRALEMALLGERVGAEQAHEWGLINRVLPADEFEPGVAALVDALAAGPTGSYAQTKSLLNAWACERLAAQLEREAVALTGLAQTADFREGVTAFVQKRPPTFTGT